MLEEVRLPSGYLDRRFFMFFEDVDLGWRCRLAGWRAVYLPEAACYHRFHGSVRRKGKNFVESQCKVNRLNSMVKNATLRMWLRGFPQTLRDVAFVSAASPRSLLKWLGTVPSIVKDRERIAALSKVQPDEVESRWMSERFVPARRIKIEE
jgi:GT2 family glycosyltransferase